MAGISEETTSDKKGVYYESLGKSDWHAKEVFCQKRRKDWRCGTTEKPGRGGSSGWTDRRGGQQGRLEQSLKGQAGTLLAHEGKKKKRDIEKRIERGNEELKENHNQKLKKTRENPGVKTSGQGRMRRKKKPSKGRKRSPSRAENQKPKWRASSGMKFVEGT